MGWMVLSLASTTALAVAGTVVSVRSSRSAGRSLAVLTLLVVGLALPLTQAWAGDGYRFHEQNAYAALFLAPPAGQALAALSRRLFRMVPVVVILLLTLVPATSRSASVYARWADVAPVLAGVETHPQPGRYLSPASETLAYYTRDDHGQVIWDSASALYTPRGYRHPRRRREACLRGGRPPLDEHRRARPAGSPRRAEGQPRLRARPGRPSRRARRRPLAGLPPREQGAMERCAPCPRPGARLPVEDSSQPRWVWS